jgi:hypothetical protein
VATKYRKVVLAADETSDMLGRRSAMPWITIPFLRWDDAGLGTRMPTRSEQDSEHETPEPQPAAEPVGSERSGPKQQQTGGPARAD